MALPLPRRDFDVFLSHAHKDAAVVERLDAWLTSAGLKVWYDKRELSGGALLATDLQVAIERCRAAIVIASGASLAQGWVKNEYNAAMDEAAQGQGFRVIALRLPDAGVKELMKGTTWIDVPADGLDAASAQQILLAFHPSENRPVPGSARDVFISCSWQPDDSRSARAVCRALMAQGLRLIGDAKDQKGFGTGRRVEQLIASCGALVAIVPFRDAEPANAESGEYKYFMREIDLAQRHGLPVVVVADPRVSRADGADAGWLRMDTDADDCPPRVAGALQALWERWTPPPVPQYVFCAMNLAGNAASPVGPLRQLVERVTGMPTVVGPEVNLSDDDVSKAVMRTLCAAFVVLADISDDTLNTCIEAGMALAVGANLELLTRGAPRRPPFMLRARQLYAYADDAERAALVHQLMRPYRRRVLNAEA